MLDCHLGDNFVPVEINEVAIVWLFKLFWKKVIYLFGYAWIWNICNRLPKLQPSIWSSAPYLSWLCCGGSRTSPEKACPFSRCSEPWPSSLPKCSRISSRRWLYVIGPPEIFTKCSLSNRRETWRPVLYIVPPTWNTASFYERQWSYTLRTIQTLEADTYWTKGESKLFLSAKHICNHCCCVSQGKLWLVSAIT